MDNSQTKNCIIDARVSTDKQLYGGSLDDQEVICKRYAEQKQWQVIKTYAKSFSGRKEERDDFKLIIKELKQMKKMGVLVDYYLIKSIDRFTRLGSGVYETMRNRLSSIGVELIDAYGVIQPEINKLEHLGFEYQWSKQSPTQIAQVIEAERSKQEVSDILVRMLSAEISLAQQGYQVRRANDGYINKDIFADGKKVKIQVPDPDRAEFYQTMFSLRAQGHMSDDAIVKHINAMGFLTKGRMRWKKDGKTKRAVGRVQGKPLTVKQFQKVIQKPIYAGVVCERWTHNKPIWSKSKGLINIDMFNRANYGKVHIKTLEDGNPQLLFNFDKYDRPIKRRMRYNPEYKYDKMLLCDCKKPLLTSASTGKSGQRFPAYHCSRNHKRVSANKKELEKCVEDFFHSIKFEDGFLNSFKDVLLNKYRQREKEMLDYASKMSSNVAELKSEKSSLLNEFLQTDNKIIKQSIEERLENVERKIINATTKRNDVEIEEHQVTSFIGHVKKIMEHPVKMLGNNSVPLHQRELFHLVFEGLPTYSKIVNGTPKLALLFKLSEDFKASKNKVVKPRGLGWNTLRQMILDWNMFCNENSEFDRLSREISRLPCITSDE